MASSRARVVKASSGGRRVRSSITNVRARRIASSTALTATDVSTAVYKSVSLSACLEMVSFNPLQTLFRVDDLRQLSLLPFFEGS